MHFVLKPSLEQRALVKMAVSLWNQNDVGALISLVYNKYRVYKSQDDVYPRNQQLKEIEARVLERVAQLSLPQPLKGKVSCFIQTVGLRIYEWIKYLHVEYHLPLSLPLELCWTPQGTVDRKRMAEALVKDERLDLSARYKLACVYCLENDVIALWNTLSGDLKQYFLSENLPDIREWRQTWIIRFWSHTVERRRLSTSYKDAFQQCAYHSHKAAVEYFLQKLTPREREESLVETAKSVMIDADTLCFLLSQMGEEQQMEVFKDCTSRVLECFLQWPFQSLFMEIANCVWDFMSKKDYESVFRNIIYKVRDGYKDCNYHELFREFWQKSPHALKSLFTDDLDKHWILKALCRIKDKGNIRLILKDATHSVKQKLIYSYTIHYFIHNNDWDSLEIFIRECFPSKDEMLKFKEAFEERVKRDTILVRNKQKWDRLFLSSGDSLCEYEKRSADEGESSSSKRFRSLE